MATTKRAKAKQDECERTINARMTPAGYAAIEALLEKRRAKLPPGVKLGLGAMATTILLEAARAEGCEVES